MKPLDRRQFLKAGAAAASFGAPSLATFAAEPATAPAVPGPVTQILAKYILDATYDDLPANVRREGTRTLLNYVGVAVGGSHTDTVDDAVRAIAPYSGPKQATLMGRKERFDIMNAAFVNGVSSHIFDFDDTHLKTIIHPGGVVIAATLAMAELRPVSGKDFLNAVVLGVETACRIGNAVSPNHLDIGWHITGTAGVFGATAAVGKLMHLTQQQMVWALGLAGSQPVGLRESFGSMNKSFNPGRAAANGIFAALLAQQNYTSSDGMIEAKRGWANVVSTKQDFREITEGLGQRYEALLNTYKPFACGIVIHPALDAAIQLRNENHLTPDAIERVDLRVNPLVLELTGKKAPSSGLEGKFSIYHSVAIALIQGAAGEKQYSDAAVRDPQTIALRARINPTIDPSVSTEKVEMTVVLKDGRTFTKHIEHAIGSVEVPMTDAQLEAKFADLADGILPKARIRALMDRCWGVEALTSAALIAKAAAG